MFTESADSFSSRPTTLAVTAANTEETDPMEVLAELFELLETYSPQWYTEEHHRRAQLALRGRIVSGQDCPETAVDQPSKR